MTESSDRDAPAALDDIRVLDLAGEPGAYCGKLLADMGADVIKVEPPGGDPARRIGPFVRDEEDPEKSLHFFANNTSKRSVTLDITRAEGRALLKRLVEKADVLIETYAPGYLDGLDIGREALSRINPGLVYCSITGFGLSGPHSRYQASDMVAVAMSGMMYLAGYPDRAPERPYGNQAYYCASIQAANGILTALIHRDRTREGQLVEVSMQEALSLNQETAIQYWDVRKEVRKRIGGEHRLPGIGTYACRDGLIFLMIGVPGFGQPLATLIAWMAEEGKAGDLVSDEWKELFGKMDLRLIALLFQGRADPAQIEEWKPRFEHVDELLSRFVADKTKAELYEDGQRRGLLVAPLNNPKDIVDNPQLKHRRWLRDCEHAELGTTLRYPGPPYRLSETPWRIGRRPPLTGEHNREVYLQELGLSGDELTALRQAGVV